MLKHLILGREKDYRVDQLLALLLLKKKLGSNIELHDLNMFFLHIYRLSGFLLQSTRCMLGNWSLVLSCCYPALCYLPITAAYRSRNVPGLMKAS